MLMVLAALVNLAGTLLLLFTMATTDRADVRMVCIGVILLSTSLSIAIPKLINRKIDQVYFDFNLHQR